MSTPLIDQLRAYFDDVDRQQGAVDIDALRCSVEERVITIELAPHHVVLPNRPSSGRRWPILIAAAVVAIALVAIHEHDATPADQPSPTMSVPPTTPPRPLPDGSGTAPVTILPGTYFVDKVAGISIPRVYATLGVGWSNWSDGSDGWNINKRDDNGTFEETVSDDNMTPEEAFDESLQHDVGVMDISRPVAVYLDACHWQDGNHPGPLDTVDGLVAALREQRGWAQVTAASDISIDGYVGKAFQRVAPTDMSDCTITGLVGPRYGSRSEHRDFRSWEAPENHPPGWAGHYYEPGWIETLWVLDLDATIVVISTGVWPEPSAGADADFAADVLNSIRIARDSVTASIPGDTSFTEQLVRSLDPPIDCGLEQCPWPPEFTAQPLDAKFACTDPAWRDIDTCVSLAVSPNGTLVAFDAGADTLTWYEDEPRVVLLTDELGGEPVTLGAIGPFDIAYFAVGPRPNYFVAVAPSGAEITRVDTSATGAPYLHPLATGLGATLVERLDDGRLMPPNTALWMPWVDLDGNLITDTRPYPTTTVTDAGLEVHLGDREWLLAAEEFSDGSGLLFFPQSDGGVVMRLVSYGGSATEPVSYLSTDGAIQHYSLDIWPSKVLPDGSLIVVHNRELIRLTPPA